MHWELVISVFTVVAANLGTVLILYINLDKKIDENRRESNDILKAIQAEMKDFHGRLCAIEERKK